MLGRALQQPESLGWNLFKLDNIAPLVQEHFAQYQNRLALNMKTMELVALRRGGCVDHAVLRNDAKEKSVRLDVMSSTESAGSVVFRYSEVVAGNGGAKWKYFISQLPRQGKRPSAAKTAVKRWATGETGQEDESIQGDGGADEAIQGDGGADEAIQGDGGADMSIQGDGGADEAIKGDGGADESIQGDGGADEAIQENGRADKTRPRIVGKKTDPFDGAYNELMDTYWDTTEDDNEADAEMERAKSQKRKKMESNGEDANAKVERKKSRYVATGVFELSSSESDTN